MFQFFSLGKSEFSFAVRKKIQKKYWAYINKNLKLEVYFQNLYTKILLFAKFIWNSNLIEIAEYFCGM